MNIKATQGGIRICQNLLDDSSRVLKKRGLVLIAVGENSENHLKGLVESREEKSQP